MARVLVTGANGFIGKILVQHLLDQGDEVACLVRSTSKIDSLPTEAVELLHGDVRDLESLKKATARRDVVYHLAGCVLALKNRDFYEVNREGMKNIAAACADQPNPPRLLLCSSLAAGGPSPKGEARTESDPCHPVSAYGKSKLAGEEEARRFADRVPITIVRPPIVLGEGDRMGLPLFRSIDRFHLHLIPDIRRRRYSVIHAADLSHLFSLAAARGKTLTRENNPPGEGIYYAASEIDPPYVELGRIIAEAMNIRVMIPLPATIPVVWIVGLAMEGVSQCIRRPLYLHLDKVREITAGSWVCSTSAAKRDLGFTVGKPLKERMRQTAEWYRANGWL